MPRSRPRGGQAVGRPRRRGGEPVSAGDGGGPGRRVVWALVLLALAGLGISGYLAALHFTGGQALCPAGSSCDVVLASQYARLLGIPLAVIGVAGYGALGALSGLLLLGRGGPRLYQTLVLMVLAGFTFSAYLVGTQLFAIGSLCYYCLGSAGVMTAMAATALLGWRGMGRGPGPLLVPTGLVAAAVLLGALALPRSFDGGVQPAADYQTALASHLTDVGAVMYGAYWCPHCQTQKERFGEAFRYVNYVECDPGGKNARPSLCAAKGIKGYPTWEIAGAMYEGARPLEELARLSGFSPGALAPP